jgi:glycosyltransferase involved in cell wall biosynthesis
VTAVIPVWGVYADARLDEAIASIQAQDEPAAIVLVDNAGHPALEHDEPRIVRSERRLPLGAARNLGLDAADTPMVIFWDADDLMPAGTLAALVRQLDDEPSVVVSGARIIDSASGGLHHWPRRWPFLLARFPRAFATLNAVNSLYPVIGSVLRTAAAREARFPDVSSGDDWVMGVSLAFRGHVRVRLQPGRIYRRHPSSLSASWTAADALAHARLVRGRLRVDPAVPSIMRRLVPVIWLGQQAVLRLFRPIARRAPRRRRDGT